MLKKLLLIISLTLILSGCASEQAQEAEPTGKDEVNNEQESAEQKEFNMGLFWLDSNIEPTESWHGWTLARCGIGENLIQFDENMNLKNVIAESWDIVDERIVSFKIRDGITFHNGNPVDANAVKASLERALSITNRDDVKFPLETMEVDGNTITITTTEPYATLINNLADPVYTIVDTTVADEELQYQPVSTGPFKVVDFTPEEGMTLSKHPDYWQGEVAVDKINVRYIQDASIRSAALQSKEIDFATQLNASDLPIFEEGDSFNVLRGPNLRIFLLRLNMDKPYMQDHDFRKALKKAIDTETYANNLVNGTMAKGPFTDLLSFGYQGDPVYSYDPEAAVELLDNAGYLDTNGDGFREYNGEKIVLTYISNTGHGRDANNIGEAIQSQLKEIGLEVEVIQIEDYSDLTDRGEYDFRWERWTSAPTGDPQYFLEAAFKTDGAGNRGGYSNEELDALIEELNQTLEPSERDKLGVEASRLLMEDIPAIFLYYGEGNVVTNSLVEGVGRFISEVYYIDHRLDLKDE